MPTARILVPLLVGTGVAIAVGVRLQSALTEVPNRHALGWDSARRAMLNVEAADALRARDLGGFLRYVAGPETWPTLRLTLAAPLHALAGPTQALAVEHGLSLVFTAALFLVLALAALSLAPRTGDAVLVFAIAAALLLGNRALLAHAANGMLEVPSALLTLATAATWIASRTSASPRPWSVALLGNLLFHVKWQHGMILAAAVLLTEAVEAGAGDVLRAVGAALGRAARTWWGVALLCLAGGMLILAGWVGAGGGIAWRLFGHPVSLRAIQGPVAFGALALFAWLEIALFRERHRLALEVPGRVRFLWTWLATPMAAWLLVPFTWRLRTLMLTSFEYQSGVAPPGLLARLGFYPSAMWNDWPAPGVRWLVAALLAGSAVAAWRSVRTRRVLVPLVVVVITELVALLLLSRRNYQERFVLNLAPLLALGAAAWVPAVPRTLPRTALALTAAAALVGSAAPLWTDGPLVATLSSGFESTSNGDACRGIARALPLSSGVLFNQTSIARRQTCAMWVKFVARERGAKIDAYGVWPRARWEEALVLTEGCELLRPPPGLYADGAEVESGVVCGRRYLATAR